MGVYGCVLVRWGAGTTGGHRNKAIKHKIGYSGHGLGPMAGEISRNIMFWESGCKVTRMGAHGYISVRMCEIGCIVVGRSKNKAKRGTNG